MYRLAVALTQPYTLVCLLTLLAVLNLWRRRVESRRRLLALTGLVAALILLSTPAAAYLALGSLEWQHPPLREAPADAEAVVVLAGGVAPPDATRAEPAMDADTIRRCLHAAAVYRQLGGCPVVVSGGKPDPEAPGPAFAEVMREFLIRLGVSPEDVTTEEASRTTYENAVECSKLLGQRGVHKVVLVTEAVHMFRAERCFRKQGVEAVPSACNHRATELPGALLDFVPNANAVEDCQDAVHEWLGTAWYALCGRI